MTKRIYALLLALTLALVGCACSPAAPQPSADPAPAVDPEPVAEEPVADEPITEEPVVKEPVVSAEPIDAALSDFGVALLQNTAEPGENCLISPLSAYLALSMAANGAAGQTLMQMETALGMDCAALNDAAQVLMGSDGALHLANAIWFRDDPALRVSDGFLGVCGDAYQALADAVPFDDQTLAEINQWVARQTDDMIPALFSELPEDLQLLLANALCFEAKWESPYREQNLRDGWFTTEDQESRQVEMMSSTEMTYLKDADSSGFLKSYAGGRYAFGALLPNEGLSVEKYLSGLSGERLLALLENAEATEVEVQMPAFTSDTTAGLNEALQAMGMTDAFDPDAADLSAMGSSGDGNLYISSVLQKTHIEVDAQGTKAAAVTAISVAACAAPGGDEPKAVRLDRPYVYFILDTELNVPVFLGVMMDPAQ